MRKSILCCIFATLILTILFSGCEKEEIQKSNQESLSERTVSDVEVMQNLPMVKDGRLVFEDSITYINYIKWLFENQENESKIMEINKSLGFVCMKEIYDKGLELLLEVDDVTCKYIEDHPTVFHTTEIDGSIIQLPFILVLVV